MAATKIQSGVQINRLYREPYDSDSVVQTMDELQDRVNSGGSYKPGDVNGGSGKSTGVGAFYSGLYTAVVDDKDLSNNGPYWIESKRNSDGEVIATYEAHKLLRKEDIEPSSLWGQLY